MAPMAERVAILFVDFLYLYGAIGTIFAIAFVLTGVKRIDPQAVGTWLGISASAYSRVRSLSGLYYSSVGHSGRTSPRKRGIHIDDSASSLSTSPHLCHLDSGSSGSVHRRTALAASLARSRIRLSPGNHVKPNS